MKTIWQAAAAVLALGACMPAGAAARVDSPLGLRLPIEEAVVIDLRSSLPRQWVSHLLDSGRSWRGAWRAQAQGTDRMMHHDELQLRLFRTRNYATLNWEPVSTGNWKLGASVGVMRDLNGVGATTLSTAPVATYEQPNYRLSMAWMPARGERNAMVLMRFTMPLR